MEVSEGEGRTKEGKERKREGRTRESTISDRLLSILVGVLSDSRVGLRSCFLLTMKLSDEKRKIENQQRHNRGSKEGETRTYTSLGRATTIPDPLVPSLKLSATTVSL